MAKRNLEGIGDFAHLSEFIREFKDESDRAAAVLAGAYLDAILEQILRKRLVGGGSRPGGRDLVSGPLFSFSVRVDAAVALGCISQDVAKELALVNDIRNRFAHHLQGLDFGDPWVRGKVDSFRSLGDLASSEYGPVARDLFSLVTALLAADLRRRLSETTGIEPAQDRRWPLARFGPGEGD